MTNTLFALIPLLDWSGPAFLAFYACTLAILVPLCWIYRNRSETRFRHDDSGIPDDPYEVAYLAGGSKRAILLGLMQLMDRELVTLKNQRVVPATNPAPRDLAAVESSLLIRIHGAGSRGLSLDKLNRTALPEFHAIEARLAIAGLRPTTTERRAMMLRSLWPLAALALLGGGKVLIGLSRDKPVGLLLFLLLATAIAFIVLAKTTAFITPQGRGALQWLRERDEHEERDPSLERSQITALALPIALYGAGAVAGMADYSWTAKQIEQQSMTTASGKSSNGGTGCSSSDGGSSGGDGGGCGGGGCGGCGGD